MGVGGDGGSGSEYGAWAVMVTLACRSAIFRQIIK